MYVLDGDGGLVVSDRSEAVKLDPPRLANLRACARELDDQLGRLAVDPPYRARGVVCAAAGPQVEA